MLIQVCPKENGRRGSRDSEQEKSFEDVYCKSTETVAGRRCGVKGSSGFYFVCFESGGH